MLTVNLVRGILTLVISVFGVAAAPSVVCRSCTVRFIREMNAIVATRL